MPAASRRLRRIAGHLRSTRSANAAAPGASRKPARTWQEQSGLKRPAVEAEALTEEAHVQQYGCTAGQMYQFDVNGFFVMKAHYSAEQVATLNAGVDELQRIPVEHAEYMRLGVAHPLLTAAQADPEHEVWSKGRQEQEDGRPPLRVDMGICGTDKWDLIVRDEQLRKLHRTLAGGATMLSATYFIEKLGPGAAGGPLHFGGYPRQRNFHYEFDHTTNRFACYSTKATIILSDMSAVEHGPFACIPGSHKANLPCPYDMVFEGDREANPMAIPVLAEPGDVVIFTEGITHNAFPVLTATRRRSLFFNWVPAIDRNNLPSQRMSIFPEHVLERFPEPELQDMLTAPGYI